jgi:PAS domain S-box-containing protein
MLPYLSAVLSMSAFVVLWYAQRLQEDQYCKDLITAETKRIELEIHETLTQTGNAIERFANRLEYLGVKNKGYLETDAKAYLDHLPILKRIGLIDSENLVYWSYPTELGFQVQKFDQSVDPARHEALSLARKTGRGTLSTAIELRSGGLGFLMPTPLFKDGRFSGFLYATIEADKLFHTFVETPDFQIQIKEKNRVLFSSHQTAPLKNEFAHADTVKWQEREWQLEVIPTQAFVAQSNSNLSIAILIFGGVVSLLLGAYLQSLAKVHSQAVSGAQSARLLNYRLAAALDAAKMGAWNLNLTTKEVWRSENHDEIFGFSKRLDSWSIEDALVLIHPDDRERFLACLQNAAEQRSSSYEFRIILPESSETRWLNVMTYQVPGENDQVPEIFGIVRDFTEEKQDSMNRIADLDWRKAILNSSESAIISMDTNGVIQTFNASASRMLGYTAEEMIGNCTPTLFHIPEEIYLRAEQLSVELQRRVEPGFETFTAKATDLKIADENEWTFVRKDGTRFPVNLTITVLFDQNGEVAGFLGIALDLTDRKAAQAELALTTQRLTRVIEASGQGIWEREYKPGGQITYIDTSAKLMFGFKADQTLTYPEVIEAVVLDDRPKLAAAITHHIENGTPAFEAEFRIVNPQSPEILRWIHASGKVVKSEEGEARLLSTVRDVSQEVLQREEMKRALALSEEGTRAKSEFLATMSHEIRTPLNGIVGMTGLLIDTELEAQQRLYAETVRSSADHLLTIINDILDFSKIEARKLDFEDIDFDIRLLIENVYRLLALSAEKKGLKLFFSVASTLNGRFMKGDPNRISQILTNLVSNAIKFTENGQVTIYVDEDLNFKSANAQECKLRIEVTDTSIGVPESSLNRMFKPFSQADASMNRKFGGTGLGLSICKNLVEMMGGEIGVQSTQNVGSKFWFTVVLGVGEESRMKKRAAEAQLPVLNDRKIRVLLAEDNKVNQMIAVKILEKNGLRVDPVANGSEALYALSLAPYDLVLMDCQMPEVDGYEATRRIRVLNDQAIARIPIIAMTANAMVGDREKCLAAGMDDYVAKPMSQAELLSAINRALKSSGLAA